MSVQLIFCDCFVGIGCLQHAKTLAYAQCNIFKGKKTGGNFEWKLLDKSLTKLLQNLSPDL